MSRMPWFVALACAGSLLVLSCGPSEQEALAVEKAEEWASLLDQHAQLSTVRQQLAELRDEMSEGPEGDEETGLSPEEALLRLQESAAKQEQELNDSADAFSTRLVDFINEYAGYEDEASDEIQGAAIRLKSDEDIELANEYVSKGGDYRRAIDILSNARLADPDYERLQQEVEALESVRYMDEERFSLVNKKMTEDEVRATLGQVNLRNVKNYKKRDIVAWFYPKEGGAASAVYFRESRGELRVYDLDFNAVKTAAERAR